MDENNKLETILDLQKWLKAHCHYNLSYYSINGTPIYEGYCIDVTDGVYEWCFYDRSRREVIKKFEKEKDITSHAYKEITSNSWTKNNLVGIFKTHELHAILKSINALNIDYTTDELNYRKDDIRTRVFVTGCDILKVTYLIQKIYRQEFYPFG